MTRYTRVRLQPRGPFHFGGRGVGMERSDVALPADSLFSALCNVIAIRQGAAELESLLARFPTKLTPERLPPFRLTSLMPFASDLHLLPFPNVAALNVPAADDLAKRKKFKAVKWVSEAVFAAIARHEQPVDALNGEGEPVTLQGGKLWLTAQQCETLLDYSARDEDTNALRKGVLWRSQVRPRVTVDRATSASAIYAIGATRFNRVNDTQMAGLYTVIEWLNADDYTREQIRSAFLELGYDGIGGERSVGFGQFEVDWSDSETGVPGANHGSYFATLSPFYPKVSEKAVLSDGARYDITLQRGWLSLAGFQNVRRSSVRMLADGSVLRWPALADPVGSLADVTPQKVLDAAGPTIYRYGLAFPVRISDAAMRQVPEEDREAQDDRS